MYPPCHGLTYACALFGAGDQLFLPHTDPCATYLNRPWSEFFSRNGVTPEDIWPEVSRVTEGLGELPRARVLG